MSEHIVSKNPTEIHYFERFVFQDNVTTQKVWKLELRFKKETVIPTYVIVGFQEADLGDNQQPNKDVLVRLIVSHAQCIIGAE